MVLDNLINSLNYVSLSGEQSADIVSITSDSREVVKGSMFIAIKGVSADGHDYICDAIAKGASAIVCEKEPAAQTVVTTIVVPDSHAAAGIIAANFYGSPSEKLKLVGITGTNGKTTTATLLYRLFSKLGYSCGLLSTIENFIGNLREEATHTTPDPVKINLLLSRMANAGCEYCFMEVSSHAIDQKRIAGLVFTGGIFSNITHDHLDYHKTFKEYIRIKKSFFDFLSPAAFALTNTDDSNGTVMVQNTKAKIYSYSCMSPANFNCRIIEKSLDGMLLKFGNKEVWTSFIGMHNAYNLLAVYATALLLGAKEDEILVGISSMKPVAGRLEYIKGGAGVTAVIDYAHTPDALENVLRTLKESSRGVELITVFGCGGNRDQAKRPKMAAMAAKYSCKIIVTSDNPRFEDPEEIIKEVRVGFSSADRHKVLFITDRKEAIRTALSLSKPGSIVLVAGKGHERYQDIKGVKYHFDDKEIIIETFNEHAV